MRFWSCNLEQSDHASIVVSPLGASDDFNVSLGSSNWSDSTNVLKMFQVLEPVYSLNGSSVSYGAVFSVKPSTSLSAHLRYLPFYKSLLVLKNSQNPKLGPIASSLHNLYGYKNWMRP